MRRQITLGKVAERRRYHETRGVKRLRDEAEGLADEAKKSEVAEVAQAAMEVKAAEAQAQDGRCVGQFRFGERTNLQICTGVAARWKATARKSGAASEAPGSARSGWSLFDQSRRAVWPIETPGDSANTSPCPIPTSNTFGKFSRCVAFVHSSMGPCHCHCKPI